MTEELVLVVEDDPTMRLGLQKALRSAGYRVEVARDGTEGLARALAAPRPDLVLLDVMLPGRNGYEVLEEIRLVDPELIVLMLTAKGEERDKVRGLGLGADDYVTKPFGVAELLARVAAALRRRRLQDRETETVTIGAVTVDFGAHRMRRGAVELECTALELRLLRFLLRHEGSLVSRQRILDGVWGADYFGTDRTVDNFVNRLRTKLEDDPQAPRLLVTVRGAGYRFSRRPES